MNRVPTPEAYGLRRFVEAQEGTYAGALVELRAGNKSGHWMWFIFPQLQGLGRSAMSQRYGIVSLDEARCYLQDPVLGPRLHECTATVNALEGLSARQIFGTPDDMKFRSCMTLFHLAGPPLAPAEPVFALALDKYFQGQPDPLTLQLLSDG